MAATLKFQAFREPKKLTSVSSRNLRKYSKKADPNYKNDQTNFLSNQIYSFAYYSPLICVFQIKLDDFSKKANEKDKKQKNSMLFFEDTSDPTA